MKNKKMIRLANNSEFVSTMIEQKSFILRIRRLFQKFRQSILDSFRRIKKWKSIKLSFLILCICWEFCLFWTGSFVCNRSEMAVKAGVENGRIVQRGGILYPGEGAHWWFNSTIAWAEDWNLLNLQKILRAKGYIVTSCAAPGSNPG